MKSSRSSTWLVRCMAARSLIAMFWLVTIEILGWKELLTQAVEPLSLLKLLAGSENWKMPGGNHVEQSRWRTAYTVEINCFHPHSTHFDVTDSHQYYRAFSRDVTAAMLVYQNKGTAAILVYQDNPQGTELYFHANTLFCSLNQYGRWSREWKRSIGLCHTALDWPLCFAKEDTSGSPFLMCN